LIPHNPVFQCKKGKCNKIYDLFESHAHWNKQRETGEDVVIINDEYEDIIWYEDQRNIPKNDFYLNNVHVENIIENEETEIRIFEAVKQTKEKIEDALMKGEFDIATEIAKEIM
jgi:hypothetical protein